MGNYNFVVLTPGRSGSEHLSETLNNYIDIEMHGEIFNRSNKTANSFNHFLQSNFPYKLVSFFFNRGKISDIKANYPLMYLISRFLNRSTDPTSKLKGFKLTLDQLNAYPFLLQYIIKREIRIIYLYRHDRLSMVLSLIRARHTGLYHRRSNSNNSTRYFFKPGEVIVQIKNIEKWESTFLDNYPYVFLNLTYESLIDSYEQFLREIRSFLGLPAFQNPILSTLKRTDQRPLEAWVENLNDIKLALVETGTYSLITSKAVVGKKAQPGNINN